VTALPFPSVGEYIWRSNGRIGVEVERVHGVQSRCDDVKVRVATCRKIRCNF
jgi:hypothetical protein